MPGSLVAARVVGRYWQVSDTGFIGGVSGDCDFDAYNGTLAQLKANELLQ